MRAYKDWPFVVSHSDSLAIALTNICFGLFFVSLSWGKVKPFGSVTMLAAVALMLLTRGGIYLDTGWYGLETASRFAMLALIALAAVHYIRKTLESE